MRIILLLIIAGLFVLNGEARGQHCTNDLRYTEVVFFDSTEITIGTNVQYGIANNDVGSPTPLLMDLYYPTLGADPVAVRPMIMLFHGGGFSSGTSNRATSRISVFTWPSVALCVHL
ncbi:MAG: hypothetical protein IPH85_10950 [Ignavibacteria bacterium]|nr:hypothetical protein [Ignavibacteria bacterium]